MSDEEAEFVRRMQAQTEAQQPVELTLDDHPGPYGLPLCIRAAVNIRDRYTAELILDTQKGQRILVRMSHDAMAALPHLIARHLDPSRNS